MISDQVLARAVDQGLLTAEQAQSLRDLASGEATPHAPAQPPPLPVQPPPLPPPLPTASRDESTEPDDERLRFVTGFADIFVTLGIALFCGSAAYLLGLYVGDAEKWAALAVIAWLLAEFFTRRHRMALPSIVLLGLFAGSVFAAILAIATPNDAGSYLVRHLQLANGSWLSANAPTALAAALGTALFIALHYWRFRVPITIAAGAAALTAAITAAAYWLMPEMSKQTFYGLQMLCGLAIFALAMRFDMSDPQRRTRRTDIAFWLHLLAAPLIVHPFIATFVHGGTLDTATAIAILGVFLAFSIVSLVIDRRALLVSGLAYAGVAFGTLIRHSEWADKAGPATLLVLGLFILLLSAGWRPLRNGLLRLLPAALTQRLPQPRPQPS